MPAVATRAPVFSFIADGHPFAAQLGDLRARLARSDLPVGEPCEVSSEVKGVRTPAGFTLARFYCSVQSWDSAGGLPFEATTLHWSPDSGPRWARFPDEPRLPHVAAYLGVGGSQRGGSPYEVLRYVPLRRLTFRSGAVVGKFKRASKLPDAATRVAAVVAGAAGSAVTVPRLRGVDTAHGLYLQDAAAGTALSDVLAQVLAADHPSATGVTDVLAAAGRIHADFHALTAPGLPARAAAHDRADVHDRADWAAQLLPELAGWLRTTRDRLLATAPAATSAALGTCHGDLVPSHLLADDDGCTVIDLDLAHVGDRYRDLALFLSGLAADAPPLAARASSPAVFARAQDAYLHAYEERSGHLLDRRRLAWHRAAAELHQLAVVLSKDRFDPDDVPRITALVDDCVAQS